MLLFVWQFDRSEWLTASQSMTENSDYQTLMLPKWLDCLRCWSYRLFISDFVVTYLNSDILPLRCFPQISDGYGNGTCTISTDDTVPLCRVQRHKFSHWLPVVFGWLLDSGCPTVLTLLVGWQGAHSAAKYPEVLSGTSVVCFTEKLKSNLGKTSEKK